MSTLPNLHLQVDWLENHWKEVVKAVLSVPTVAKAKRMVKLVAELIQKLKVRVACAAEPAPWGMAPRSPPVARHDFAMMEVVVGLEMCQKFLEHTTAGEVVVGPSVGRGLQMGRVLLPGVCGLDRWVSDESHVKPQDPNETPLAMMDFVECYMNKYDIWDQGG